MSFFILVQRALPFSLARKRRHSASSKGKGREVEIPWPDTHENTFQSRNEATRHPRTILPRDVVDTVHVAVKTSQDPSTTPDDPASETPGTDSAPDSEYQIDQICCTDDNPPHTPVFRVVRWASIVRHRDRWTEDQEKQLVYARAQLARCQKAWSSEQELWLDYSTCHGRCTRKRTHSNALTALNKIQTLSDEKEAHEGFLLMRAQQQQQERCQFRKAWKRRRSREESLRSRSDDGEKGGLNGLGRLRLLQRYGSFASSLPMAESTVVTFRG